MLNYLLNATTIWLACLLIYELLLRNETWHLYNRLYLNLSMLAGLVIPLWRWDTDTAISSPTLQQPIQQALIIRKTINNATPDAHNAPGIYNLLLLAYIIGAAIFVAMLLREAIQLMRYYRQGSHSKLNDFTIVETQNEHGPFSIFHIIFVRSRKEFNEEQWQLLMMHEMQHGKLHHSVDKCLTIVLRVLFWFHPLVHVYYRRLMIVHEYQADSLAKNDAKVYGNFLVEQSLLQQAPMLVHSFNYSPLKKRIQMLTRKNSSRIRLVKYLVVVPILSLLILCCTKNNHTPQKERKGNKIYFNGNEFELASGEVDTTEVMNPATNETKLVITKKDSSIGKMNGEKVWEDYWVTTEVQYTGNDDLTNMLLETLQTELNTINDGDYSLGFNELIVDTKGVLVYYNSSSFYLTRAGDFRPVVFPANVKAEMIRKLDELFSTNMQFKPATVNGKPVICFVSSVMGNHRIHVENHKATLISKTK